MIGLDPGEKLIKEYILFKEIMEACVGQFRLIQTSRAYKLIFTKNMLQRDLILSKGTFNELLTYSDKPKPKRKYFDSYVPYEHGIKKEFKFHIEEFICQ